MVTELIVRVRVHQRRQRTSIDNKPGHERAELRRSEQVHLEHASQMRADGPIPDFVYPQLRELAAYTLPQLRGEVELVLVLSIEVDVHIEAAADAVVDRACEALVGGAGFGRGRVLEGFTIVVELAGCL